MKTKILIAVLLAGVCAVSAPAAEKPAAGKAPAFSEVRERIDVISKEILEEEALYWAWRIKFAGDVSYDQLQEKSKRWIGKPDTKARLFARIREILDAGSARALTAAEKEKFDEGKDSIRALLSPGRFDKKLISELSTDYCIDLKARYWARRVQGGEKEILQLRKRWTLLPEVKEKFYAAMDERLDKENPGLSKDELYKMDACTAKLHR